MSRIEIAMEKAAQQKQARVPAEVDSPALAEASTVSVRLEKLSPTNPFLVNLHDPHSPPAEQYRKLKSALVEMTRAQDGFKNSVLVTSSVPNEGKSLTSLNLAISLAQELDHTVLLVDADLRRPALHRFFEIEQGVGLSDVLIGKARIEDSIISTGIGKLSIMRAGSSIDNPAELCSSSKMRALVDELKKRYPNRYLIFDSSPVLPFAESRSLAHLVDGVLFVVMERLASQANVNDAIDSIKGCNLLGLVYNAALQGSQDVSYYRGYDTKKSQSQT
jgi:receptor protein-tyrosine kinase/non-specific protein-tyrosine kinase